MSVPQKATVWSKMVRASRIDPSALRAITCRDSSSMPTPSLSAITLRLRTMSIMLIRLKSYIWQRDRMVGITLCFSVVARMKIAYAGGSSRVFRKALKAWLLSIWTSSIMYTL